jgi:hypothetical protein
MVFCLYMEEGPPTFVCESLTSFFFPTRFLFWAGFQYGAHILFGRKKGPFAGIYVLWFSTYRV